jgi:hypothetical protein
MSSALAIASVTYVLKDLLNNGLIDHDVSGATGGNIQVSALPPPDPNTITSGDQLNLYMYRVTFNQGWRNVALPSRDGEGERVSNPPLSLNLHYLLTSYGINELHTEILLGYGMQFLHERPVLDRKSIQRSLADANVESGSGLPEKYRALSSSELAEQIEQIKITPENLSTEEISKLWTAFGAKYRPTAAYQVSVVLIESKKSTKTALRVKQSNIYVNPIHQPVIEKIKSQKFAGEPIDEDQPVLAGYILVICGRQLKSDDVVVKIGGKEVIPVKDNITDTQISISLPTGLQAGVQSVQVIHHKMMGTPPVLHQGVESNVAAFVLSPSVDPPSVTFIPATASEPAKISLSVNPPVKDTQRVILLLNEYHLGPVTTPSLSYSFQSPVLPPAEPPGFKTIIEIPIHDVKAGTYLVRIQADGAESQLYPDNEGPYTSPTVTIP